MRSHSKRKCLEVIGKDWLWWSIIWGGVYYELCILELYSHVYVAWQFDPNFADVTRHFEMKAFLELPFSWDFSFMVILPNWHLTNEKVHKLFSLLLEINISNMSGVNDVKILKIACLLFVLISPWKMETVCYENCFHL